MPHHMIILYFYLSYFHAQIVLYILHSTLVLDLTLSMGLWVLNPAARRTPDIEAEVTAAYTYGAGVVMVVPQLAVLSQLLPPESHLGTRVPFVCQYIQNEARDLMLEVEILALAHPGNWKKYMKCLINLLQTCLQICLPSGIIGHAKMNQCWLTNKLQWNFNGNTFFVGRCISPLHAKFFQREQKHAFTFYVITPHWYDTGTWNPSSSKGRTYLFYKVNIMGAVVLTT